MQGTPLGQGHLKTASTRPMQQYRLYNHKAAAACGPHLSFGNQKKWSLPPVRLKKGCALRTQPMTRLRCSTTSPVLLLYA
jgi:hypothetical protein